MFAQLPIPTIIAHRGASAYAPENTLAAFELAVRQGADAIELDAKLTADGQVVVFHDQTLERTTGVHGRVSEKTLAELRHLDAGSHFDIAYKGEPIPTLDEVLEAVGGKIFINIELTNYTSLNDDLPQKVAEIVKKHRLSQWVMFSSFNPIALVRAHRYLPEVPLGLLSRPGRAGAWARSWLGFLIPYQALHPYLEDTSQNLIERIHRRGCRVQVYTVNRPEDMRRLIQMGVDGIFTDDPLMARRVLAAPNKHLATDVW
jgi:glycerophosphoryl diester phosphodiesterase